MKVKPLFSYSEGSLGDAEGNALVASPAQLLIDDLSAGVAESDMAALAGKGANLILLRISLEKIALPPDSYNEAALARLREILKSAEEKRVAAVLSIEDDSRGASPDLLVGAAEHSARRLKDCASLIGLAMPNWAGEGFLLELAARLGRKHPTLLFFVPPGKEGGESAGSCRAPFVSPEFYPKAWLQ